MRRDVILYIVFIGIFLIGGVNGQGICGGNMDQLILKLSGETNAHGAVFDKGTYTIGICYNDPELWGVDYNVISDPNFRDCTGDNTVLKLSNSDNAHAEGPLGTKYAEEVCYGDLVCSLISESGCVLPSKIVVRLSDNTNAHLEVSSPASGAKYTGDVICCSTGGLAPPPASSGIYWADMNGVRIDSAYIGDRVKLIANNLESDKEVVFQIWDDDFGIDDKIRTIAGGNEFTVNSDSIGHAEVEWRILDSEVRGAFSGADADNGFMELYFEAKPEGSTALRSENKLQLFDDVRNVIPTPKITDLEHRGIYFVETEIIFGQDSSDVDGEIVSIRWTIEEGASGFPKTISNIDADFDSFIYEFSTPGQKTITLRAIDDDGDYGEEQISILVIASDYMLAYINKPFHHEILKNFDNVVNYDATESFVVSSLDDDGDGCPEVECKAGNCPTPTKNVPEICIGITEINVDESPQDFSEVYFGWTVDGVSIGGSGNDFSAKTKTFGKRSSSLNDKKIELKMSYFDGVFPGDVQAENTVQRDFTLGTCLNNGRDVIVFSDEGYSIVSTTAKYVTSPEKPVCDIDGIENNGIHCCPPGNFCRDDGTEELGCYGVTPPDEKIGCDSYNDIDFVNTLNPPNGDESLDKEWSCNGDIANLRDIDPLYISSENKELCDDENSGYRCECFWNSNVCEYEERRFSGGSGGDCSFSCQKNPNEPGVCVNGLMSITKNTVFKGSGMIGCEGELEAKDQCEEQNGQTVDVFCGRPELELPLFGIIQFWNSIIIIFIFYVLVVLHRVFK